MKRLYESTKTIWFCDFNGFPLSVNDYVFVHHPRAPGYPIQILQFGINEQDGEPHVLTAYDQWYPCKIVTIDLNEYRKKKRGTRKPPAYPTIKTP